MKTLGRILIILVVFIALSALMVIGVNASGLNQADFRPEGGEFRPSGELGDFPPPPGFNPEEGGGRVRPEGFEDHDHEERGEGGFGFGGLMFGAARNTLIIAVLVVLIVVPRNAMKQKKKNASQSQPAVKAE